MSATVPPSVVVPFAIDGTRNTIPVAPDVGFPGRASYELGFPPVTMINRQSGGIPPEGRDFNGIYYALSAHIAWQAAGGQYIFNPDVVTLVDGYDVGAILQSASDPTVFFYNATADNANNPDVDATGWIAFSPLSTPSSTLAQAVATGSVTVSITGSVGFLDLSPSSGDTTLTDILGGTIGQTVTVTNMDPSNSLTLQAGASIRLSANLVLLQNGSITLRRRTSSQWVAIA